MAWKKIKSSLFKIAGPLNYQRLHAFYFFIRLVVASLSLKWKLFSFGKKFFGRDLIAFGEKLNPGDTVLDIGAFLGASTLLFAGNVQVTGKVIAFEPVHTVALNKILNPFNLPQLKIESLALANKNGFTEIIIPIHNGVPLYSQAGFADSYETLSKNSEYRFLSQKTELKKLDDYLSENKMNSQSIHAVKIDVEGAEMQVFLGGENFFSIFNGLLMCEFWFNEMPPPGWIWLKNQGYECQYLKRDGSWIGINTTQDLDKVCEGETYGNFFWKRKKS